MFVNKSRGQKEEKKHFRIFFKTRITWHSRFPTEAHNTARAVDSAAVVQNVSLFARFSSVTYFDIIRINIAMERVWCITYFEVNLLSLESPDVYLTASQHTFTCGETTPSGLFQGDSLTGKKYQTNKGKYIALSLFSNPSI